MALVLWSPGVQCQGGRLMMRYAAVIVLGMAPGAFAAPGLALGEAPGADCVAPRLYAPVHPPGLAAPDWYAGIGMGERLDVRCGIDAAACPVGFFSSRCNGPGEAHYLALDGQVLRVRRWPVQEGVAGYDGLFLGEGVRMRVTPLPGWSFDGDAEQHYDTKAIAQPVEVTLDYKGQVLRFRALYDGSP